MTESSTDSTDTNVIETVHASAHHLLLIGINSISKDGFGI